MAQNPLISFMKVHAFIPICALLTGFITVPVFADSVQLKNGRVLEGLVQEETKTHVVLDMGLGSVKLKKSSIDAMTRSGTNDAAKIQDQWKSRYYDRDQYAPDYGMALAKQLRGVEGAARAADRTATRLQRETTVQRQLITQLSAHRINLTDSLTALEGLSAKDNARKYNSQVAVANRHTGLALRSQQQLDASLQRVENDRVVIAKFLKAHDELQAEYDVTYTAFLEQGSPESDQHFFDAVRTRMDGLAARMKMATVPHEKRGNQAVVKTRINDVGDAQLLLDTGAALVTLSEIAARRLGVELKGKDFITLTLANGSTVKAEPVMLKSVQVGDARLENVPAAVLAAEESGDMDGLLGMSFLQAFKVHINGANGDLALERFQPH